MLFFKSAFFPWMAGSNLDKPPLEVRFLYPMFDTGSWVFYQKNPAVGRFDEGQPVCRHNEATFSECPWPTSCDATRRLDTQGHSGSPGKDGNVEIVMEIHISCTASGSENLAQAQVLMHTTCRTQEGISRSLEKKTARIQQCSIKVLGVLIPWKGTKEKFTDILSSLGAIFQLACWLAWGGFNLALLLTGFSLESCLPPLSSQRNRSTTRTKVYLSQVAFAQIMQSMASQTASFQFAFRANSAYSVTIQSMQNRHERQTLLNEGLSRQKWLQKSGWRTKRKHFKNYKTAKNVLQASRIWGSRIRGSD